MGKTVSYEGYTIQSASRCRADGGKWQLRILISFEQHGGVKTREFSADVLYATEQEADIHGIAFGQRLIDGKVEGQSVMDIARPNGITRKNQTGSWGRKTKLTQGASVNTPRHCSEMFLYFLRLLVVRQMKYFPTAR